MRVSPCLVHSDSASHHLGVSRRCDDAEMMINSSADRIRIGIIEMLFLSGARAMNEFIIVKSTAMMIRISLEGVVTIYFFPIMTPIHLWPGQ